MSQLRSQEEFERWRKDKMCGPPTQPKIRYSDRSKAKAVVRRLSRKDVKMADYKCEYCGFYHVGHKPNKTYAQWARIDNDGVTDDELIEGIERQREIDAATDDELFELLDGEELAG